MSKELQANVSHSEGPWNRYVNESGEPTGLVCDAFNRLVASASKECSRARMDANANLIAAAPELLEALDRITAYAGRVGSDFDSDGAISQALAAIAKARP